MKDRPKNNPLLRHVVGSLLGAVFFVIAPFEVLSLGAVVWIPLLIWRERLRAARYGWNPGLAARTGVVALVFTTALLLPTKLEDGRVGPFPRNELSLGQLAVAGVIYPLATRSDGDIRVTLPSSSPTRREVMKAIAEQTAFSASIFHCGNGSTVLFGSAQGRIKVREVVEGKPAGVQ